MVAGGFADSERGLRCVHRERYGGLRDGALLGARTETLPVSVEPFHAGRDRLNPHSCRALKKNVHVGGGPPRRRRRAGRSRRRAGFAAGDAPAAVSHGALAPTAAPTSSSRGQARSWPCRAMEIVGTFSRGPAPAKIPASIFGVSGKFTTAGITVRVRLPRGRTART